MSLPKDKKLKYFVLFNVNNPKNHYIVHLNENEDIIYFRRNFFDVLTSINQIVFVIGIRNKETNNKFYLFIR